MPSHRSYRFRLGISFITTFMLIITCFITPSEAAEIKLMKPQSADTTSSMQAFTKLKLSAASNQIYSAKIPSPNAASKTPNAAPTISSPLTKYISRSENTSATRMLTVKITRTDNLGEQIYAGDRLTFDISYTNMTDRAVTAFPRSSNLSNVAVTATSGACRWANLQPGATQTCHSGFYKVSEKDVAAGKFTPTVTFDATADRAGNEVLDANIVVTGDPIMVKSGERPTLPDPSEIPTNRAPGKPVVLARSGEKGFDCYRIPALTTANNGWILAAWDGRPGGCSDAPNPNSIVQRISKDGGKSWLPQKVIAAGNPGASKYGYSDPSYVTDRKTGEIFMFFVKSYDNGIFRPHTGVDPNDRQVLHAAVMSSKDNGETWSEPKVITDAITKDPNTWAGRFAASGEGIQLRYGAHAGRLVQQYTVRIGETFKAVSVYSDDHGATWQAGEPFGVAMDENKVVELSDGRLMVNSRTSDSSQQLRKVAISADGGHTYSEVRLEPQLLDPRNNASIIRAFPDAPQGSAKAKILLFSNAHATSRVNGTIHVSFDDGVTWSQHKVFEPDVMQYSTLTPLPQAGHYGLLYEHPNGAISYTEITLDWLGLLPLLPAGQSRNVYRGGNLITLTVTNLSSETVQGATLSALAPAEWSWQVGDKKQDKITIPVDKLAPNGTFQTQAKLLVPAGTDPGEVKIPLTVSYDGKTANGSVTVNVILKDNEHASRCIANVSIANVANLPAEMVNEQTPVANMLDGDITTIWHTPWAGGITLPLDIDFIVPRKPGLTNVQLSPRTSGNNGRVETADLYLVEGKKETIIGGGQIPNNGNLTLSLPKGYETSSSAPLLIRARIKSTIGDEKNKWVSMAEVCFRLTDQTPPTHDEVVSTPLQPAQPIPAKPTPVTPTPVKPTPAKPTPSLPKDNATSSDNSALPTTGAEVTGVTLFASFLLLGGSIMLSIRRRQ